MDERLKGFADYNGMDPKDMGTLILAASSTGEFTSPIFPDYLEKLGIREGDSPDNVIFKIRVKISKLEANKQRLMEKNDDRWAAFDYEISIVENVLNLLAPDPEEQSSEAENQASEAQG